MNLRHIRTSDDTRIADRAASQYDAMSEDLSLLGDQMELVGAEAIAQTCREFAYIAWRAAQAEHLDPTPGEVPHG